MLQGMVLIHHYPPIAIQLLLFISNNTRWYLSVYFIFADETNYFVINQGSRDFFSCMHTANINIIFSCPLINSIKPLIGCRCYHCLALISWAIILDISLAPPICPDNSGITNLPRSSMEITAGSTVLFLTKVAMALTAIPQAPI
jgi:hypothetical protein